MHFTILTIRYKKGYIEIRNLIRLEVIRSLKKNFKERFDSLWKFVEEIYKLDARESNYEHGFTREAYKGNVCSRLRF